MPPEMVTWPELPIPR